MVSKAGIDGATDKALVGQLSFYPQALGMAAAVMGIVAVLPGMPTLVFAPLAGGTGALAWYAYKRKTPAPPKPPPRWRRPMPRPRKSRSRPPWRWTCCGSNCYGLLPLINDVQGHRITDQIKALRKQLAQEMASRCPPSASWTICSWAPTNITSASRSSIPARANCSPAPS